MDIAVGLSLIESQLMSESHYLKDELYTLFANDPKFFDFLQKASLDGLWYWDLENPDNEWMSPEFWRLLGYKPEDKKHLASEWQELIDPDDLKEALSNFHAHCADPNHPYDQVVRYQHTSGKTIWVRCRGIVIRDEQGKPIRMLGAHNDITALKELENELKQMVLSDALTGLASRRAFDEHFEWSIRSARRNNEFLSLAVIDIDDFKHINDSFGHQTGDAVLTVAGEAIRQVCRESDFAARFGGEEFVVLMHGSNTDASTMIGERIRKKINALDLVDKHITVSIGVSTLHPSLQQSSKQLMERIFSLADKALYLAKKSGKNRVIHADDVSSV